MGHKTEKALPEVSGNSTKKELLDAFNELKKVYEERRDTELNPEKVKEEKRKQEVVAVAESELRTGIDPKIKDLQMEFTKALTELGERLKAETAKFAQIQAAIEFKTAELREIYDIEQSASALAALIEAQRRQKEEFEQEIAQQRAETERELAETKADLEAGIEATRAAWEQEKLKFQAANKEQKDAEAKERVRRKEEFEYAFQRESQTKKDQLADELARQEKELAQNREEFDKRVVAKDAELQEREERISLREKLTGDLQRQVDNFPKELEAKIKQAVKDATDRLTLQAENSEKLLRAELAGEKNVLLARIEALEALVKSQERQNATLYSKLEAAYGNVQDIAVKAVDSAAKQSKNITVQATGSGKEDGKNRD